MGQKIGILILLIILQLARSQDTDQQLNEKWSLVIEMAGQSSSKRAVKINGAEWKLSVVATPIEKAGFIGIEIIDENNKLIKNVSTQLDSVLKSSDVFNGNGTFFLTINSQNVNWRIDIYENDVANKAISTRQIENNNSQESDHNELGLGLGLIVIFTIITLGYLHVF